MKEKIIRHIVLTCGLYEVKEAFNEPEMKYLVQTTEPQLNHLFLVLTDRFIIGLGDGFIGLAMGSLYLKDIQMNKEIEYNLTKSLSENLDNPDLCNTIAELLYLKTQ